MKPEEEKALVELVVDFQRSILHLQCEVEVMHEMMIEAVNKEHVSPELGALLLEFQQRKDDLITERLLKLGDKVYAGNLDQGRIVQPPSADSN